jgi:hypothetical protein
MRERLITLDEVSRSDHVGVQDDRQFASRLIHLSRTGHAGKYKC